MRGSSVALEAMARTAAASSPPRADHQVRHRPPSPARPREERGGPPRRPGAPDRSARRLWTGGRVMRAARVAGPSGGPGLSSAKSSGGISSRVGDAGLRVAGGGSTAGVPGGCRRVRASLEQYVGGDVQRVREALQLRRPRAAGGRPRCGSRRTGRCPPTWRGRAGSSPAARAAGRFVRRCSPDVRRASFPSPPPRTLRISDTPTYARIPACRHAVRGLQNDVIIASNCGTIVVDDDDEKSSRETRRRAPLAGRAGPASGHETEVRHDGDERDARRRGAGRGAAGRGAAGSRAAGRVPAAARRRRRTRATSRCARPSPASRP